MQLQRLRGGKAARGAGSSGSSSRRAARAPQPQLWRQRCGHAAAVTAPRPAAAAPVRWLARAAATEEAAAVAPAEAAAAAAPEAAPGEAAPAAEQPPAAAAAAATAAAEQPEATEQPAAAVAPPKLSDLPLQAVINPQGYVAPAVPDASVAAVFAVYDEQQKLQYIGFSKELRASLRIVLGRRPDKTFYFKATFLQAVDQDAMLAIRQAWFDECGAPPPGNKLALERKAWQSAVDAGAISARAKPAAAAEKAKDLQALLRQRGCVEEFVPDPDLLAEGQVDFLSHAPGDAQAVSDAAQQAASAAAADAAAARNTVRTATAVVDGQAKNFMVEYLMKFPTKGGYMVDVKLSFDHMDTRHRIIVGKSYYEPYNVGIEGPIEAALALMLARKMPRHNEGMLGTADFPVNYFTISEMEQWFEEEFAAQFLHITGHQLQDGTDTFWRMNKIHDYGSKLEDPRSLGAALTQRGLGQI